MNFLGLGPMELLLILVLALVVFGPGKLPEIMGQVGKAVNDFRKATAELTDEFNKTLQSEIDQTRAAVEGTTPAAPVTAPAPTAEGTTAEPAPPPAEASPSWHWEAPQALATGAEAAKPTESDTETSEPSAEKQAPRTGSDDLLPPY